MNNTTILRLPVGLYMKCQNRPTFKPYNKLLTNAVRLLSRFTDLPVLGTSLFPTQQYYTL